VQAPPAIRPRNQRHLWLLGGILLLSLGALVLFWFNPSQYSFYPKCRFYQLTGLYCPGCGAQRSLYHLVHGHFLTGIRCNPLFVLALPILAYMGIRLLLPEARRRAWPSITFSERGMITLGVILVVFTIVRNIPHAPFTFLAPP
jgi:Protein of unknown function (DUF2752)